MTEPLVKAYLEELASVAAQRLSAPRSAELVAEIREHIDAAVSEGRPVPEVLDRLGSPHAIVDAEAPERTTVSRPQQRLRAQEIAAILLLVGGGFVFIIGWFVGAALLWTSDRWSRLDKLIGTLLLPGGLAPVVILGGATATTTTTIQECVNDVCTTVGGDDTGSNAPLIVFAIILLLTPVATAIYLARRAKLPSRP